MASSILITCVKGKPKLVGKGVYRTVYKVGNLVIKVERGKTKDPKKLWKRAVEIDSRQRKIRKELTFLPAYYGTALTEVRQDGVASAAIITFHEYVKPLPTYSIRTLRAIFNLIEKASKQGYVLDIKPSNFGEKQGKIFYLDEYGLGKGPLPPDVLEDLNKFIQFALKKLKPKRPAWPRSLRKRS